MGDANVLITQHSFLWNLNVNATIDLLKKVVNVFRLKDTLNKVNFNIDWNT